MCVVVIHYYHHVTVRNKIQEFRNEICTPLVLMLDRCKAITRVELKIFLIEFVFAHSIFKCICGILYS